MDIRFILIEGKQTKHVRVSQQAVPHANEIGIDRTAAAPDTQSDRATPTTTANTTTAANTTTHTAHRVMGLCLL